MALAFDNSSQQTTNSSTLSYVMGTVSQGLLIVAVVGDSINDNLTGVTFNSVAMTLINKIQYPGDRWIYLYGLANPASGTHNIVASGLTFCELSAISYSGAAQTGIPDSTATASVTSVSSIALTTTVVAANCWLVGLEYGGTSKSVGAGTTARGTITVNPSTMDSNGTVGTGASSLNVNMGAGSTAVGLVASIAPFVAPVHSGGMFFAAAS